MLSKKANEACRGSCSANSKNNKTKKIRKEDEWRKWKLQLTKFVQNYKITF